jgi:hypothetical protein
VRPWTSAALLGLALLVGSVPPALAQTGSFVDADNNGVWSTGDVPLSQFLGPSSFGFNALAAQPGWKPKSGPVGLVIQGPLVLTNWYLDFQVTGDIRFRGKLESKAVDAVIAFRSLSGNIYIEPSAVIVGSGQMELTAIAGDLRVGKKAQLSNKGSQSDLDLDAGNELYIETGAVFSSASNDYPLISIWGTEKLTLEPGVKFTGGSHTTISLTSMNDIALDKVSITSGYIRIEAYADEAHPAAKRILVTNSTLSQTYKNGDFRMIAKPDRNTLRYAPEAIVIQNTILKLRTGTGPLFIPNPIIR